MCKVEYVQTIYANDDAFEFFGGTVNCRDLHAWGTACACKAAWSAINEPSIRNGTIALVMVPAAVFYFWVLFRHILIIRVTRIKNRQP